MLNLLVKESDSISSKGKRGDGNGVSSLETIESFGVSAIKALARTLSVKVEDIHMDVTSKGLTLYIRKDDKRAIQAEGELNGFLTFSPSIHPTVNALPVEGRYTYT